MNRIPVLLILVFTTVPAVADDQLRLVSDDRELERWLQNMVWHHRFTPQEVRQVTGLDALQQVEKLKQFGITADNCPPRPHDRLFVLPYPGGRHPRTGFLDGAIAPQRDTKLSVFCPWDNTSYAVLDVPEAIWSNLGLTHLAHTHIDTVWSKQNIDLPQRAWSRLADGTFVMQRTLPNGIRFGTRVSPRDDHLAMEMWLFNGTLEPLRDLRVQNCVMLKAVDGFSRQTNDNKQLNGNYALAHSDDRQRWIIKAGAPLHRNWANAPCPCLHADPKFADCPPAEFRALRGWFSFYQGSDITAELQRIEATNWRLSAIQTRPPVQSPERRNAGTPVAGSR